MRILRSASLFALLAAAFSAQAVVLDFEGLTPTRSEDWADYYGPSVAQSGFAFSTGSGFASTKAFESQYNYTWSTALFADADDETITLQRVGGGTFSLRSLDVANLYLSIFGPQGQKIDFTGVLAGGGTVTQSVTLASGNDLQSVAFSGFDGLTSVSWNQGGAQHQFDNVDVVADAAPSVPGPLAALPFALMALRRRRRA